MMSSPFRAAARGMLETDPSSDAIEALITSRRTESEAHRTLRKAQEESQRLKDILFGYVVFLGLSIVVSSIGFIVSD